MTEIGDWLDETYLKFAEKENTNPCRSAREFLQRYVLCDAYESFFGTIHIELHQWLTRLAEKRTNFREGGFSVWTPARVNIVQSVNNEISRAVDFWTTQTLEAFMTEFSIDTGTSFSDVERRFFHGPRGKLLNLFSLRIKMLLVEKGILLFESDC